MKHIYLNIKRFDIPLEYNGINRIASMGEFASTMVRQIENGVSSIEDLDFAIFFPEGHLLNASKHSMKVKVGSQGVFRDDVEKGRNFGAFTTFLPSTAATSLGATQALIGHTEERANLLYIITMGKGSDVSAMHNILNQEVQCAIKSGMKVLFCVGEKTEEQPRRFEVLKEQLEIGLHNVDLSKVVVAYEPVWAIGNNKPIPTKEYISEIVSFIKSVVNVDVVYGGGLKVDNASMLASIPLLDGGLIGLTEFGEHFGFSTKGYLEIVNTYREAVIQHQNVEELE